MYIPTHWNQNFASAQVHALSCLFEVCDSESLQQWSQLQIWLNLKASTTQNGQTHSKNSSSTADGLFECVWYFCGVGAWRFSIIFLSINQGLLRKRLISSVILKFPISLVEICSQYSLIPISSSFHNIFFVRKVIF